MHAHSNPAVCGRFAVEIDENGVHRPVIDRSHSLDRAVR